MFDVGYVGGEGKTVIEAASEHERSLDAEITAKPFDTKAAVRTAVENGDLDAAVIVGSGEHLLLTGSDPSDVLTSYFRAQRKTCAAPRSCTREGFQRPRHKPRCIRPRSS